MNGTIDELIPDWREKINESSIGSIKNNMTEMLPILEQLVKDRNIEGIQEFYQKVWTDTVDMNDDRDLFFYKFLMQFCNMASCGGVMEERAEPTTKHHYLCFKCVYHRGEEDEFSVIVFFKKWDAFFPEYKYQCFLMYNNLVGMETYLHTYEFKEPVFDEKYMVQCNNLVLSFRLEGTEQENLLYPAIHYNEGWISFIYDKLEEMGLYARNVLINGEDLTVVIDLWRSVTLKSNSLKYILGKVEEQLLLRLQDYHVYDNEHFFMVPGSINARKHISINKKTKLMFSNKDIEGNAFLKREDGYYRCYYVGMDNYPFPAASLSKLAETVGFPKKEKQEDADKRKRLENKKRFTRVGRERLEDLDKLAELRQNEIRERFHFFRIMGNILFYLGKEPAEVLQYMNDRNKRLYVPISESCLLRIFTFCKEDYEKYLSDPELGIKYTNQRIVELLQIRKYEQEEMKQLIGETEAWERNKVSHIISTRKAYAPIKHDKRYAREMKEEADKEEFLQMRQLGMSNNQIAKKKHVDTRKVDRLIGKNTEKEAERELLKQKIVEMTANGKSASKISKELGVSVSTVRRIRAKTQQ